MKRPVIGINTDLSFHEDGTPLHSLRVPYTEAVLRAGGAPFLLPCLEEAAAPPSLRLDALDGLLMTGGDDLDPRLYGESERHPAEIPLDPARQSFDLELLGEALDLGLPLLCICLGVQELAVAFGGRLHRYLPESLPGALQHGRVEGSPSRHEVLIEEGSLLGRILGPRTTVNSTHHQAVASPGRGQRVAARAPDGVIEALEIPGPVFRLGVQWHPELILDEPGQLDIFGELVARAAARR